VQLCPFWRVRIEGRDRIPADRAAVLVANHQSAGDILVLFGIKRHFKWVSKASVFKVPFIGWNMGMNDYVGLVRGDRRSIVTMMKECREHLRRGSSLLFFPEGTRSTDGEIKRFKHGAFSLAAKQHAPVVPVVVDGTIDALPKSGWVFRNGRQLDVTVRILDPIEVAPDVDAAALSEQVRAAMVEQLADIRQEHLGAIRPAA
jgi:1-acyl-sn-glycerol-3-phosphate acyltransferase